jgi:ligand-binding SRPBCC domain-containing protein
MTKLYFETVINSEKEIVFDLSRNIDLHQSSMKHTEEKVISGKASGLIELGETVTFKGKHFRFYFIHQSKITEMTFYKSFTDEMTTGSFKSFVHHHRFISKYNCTLMVDEIIYKTPGGILGQIFNMLFLKKYLRHLIEKRNSIIKSKTEKTKRLN